MKQREITDEMVERACSTAFGDAMSGTLRKTMRAALEAALTQPEPEIEVTEAMTSAAFNAYLHPECPSITRDKHSFYTRVYRAMRALEPKPVLVVTNEAVAVAARIAFQASCDGRQNSSMREALNAALPYIKMETGMNVRAETLYGVHPGDYKTSGWARCIGSYRSGPCGLGDACCMGRKSST